MNLIKYIFIALLMMPFVFMFPIITNIIVGLSRTLITNIDSECFREQIKLVFITGLTYVIAILPKEQKNLR